MSNQQPLPVIVVGRMSLRQHVSGSPILVEFAGKLGVTQAEIEPRQLEQWLLRVLREKVFS